jgi:HK97 family phage major capsid protein
MDQIEIRKRMDQILGIQRGMNALAESEKRDLLPDESTRYDALNVEYNELERQLDAKPTERPYLPDFGKKRVESRDINQGLPGVEFRKVLFGGKSDNELDDGGFKNFGDFLQTVTLKPSDSRALNVLSGTEGGFAVPPRFASAIWSVLVEQSFAFQKCRMFNIVDETGNDFGIPTWDSYDHSNEKAMAGVAASYVGELVAATEVEPKMKMSTLTLKKIAMYLSASREILSDGLGIDAQISQIMRTGITFTADRDILRGAGLARPLGVLSAPSKVSVARKTANDVEYQDILTMRSRMYPACLPGAVWIASSSAELQMGLMETTGGHLIWTPGTPLLGLPVIITEHASSCGTEGDLMLVNFGEMALLVKGTIIIESTNAYRWTQDAISFRCLLRYDAQPLWALPVRPAQTTVQQSWAVTLV